MLLAYNSINFLFCLGMWTPVLYVTDVSNAVQGFLQKDVIEEACKDLLKRCTACTGALMQNIEKLDAVVSLETKTA